MNSEFLKRNGQARLDGINVRKTFQGAYEVSEVINGTRVHKTYFGYTKQVAINSFKKSTR